MTLKNINILTLTSINLALHATRRSRDKFILSFDLNLFLSAETFLCRIHDVTGAQLMIDLRGPPFGLAELLASVVLHYVTNLIKHNFRFFFLVKYSI